MGNKYDWAAAPDWAVAGATDKNGSQWWYEKEPSLGLNSWNAGCGIFIEMETQHPHFSDSLERRP